jgi:uncharacterized Zn finger protein (UPF0148 family)
MLVKCPNCKTKFVRAGEVEETCGVCETKVTLKEVKQKTNLKTGNAKSPAKKKK